MRQFNNGEVSASEVKVYLLAENRLLRETLARLLQKRAGICVVGVSRYHEMAIREVATSGCDILLADCLTNPEESSLLRELFEDAPQIKVVLFGMDEEPAIFLRSVYLGVSGYILKEASASEIIAAVRGVAQGEAACPSKLCMALIQHLAHEYRENPRIAAHPGSAKGSLTHRQLQLVDLVEKGLTNKEIAASLNLSEFTVKNHLRRIMRQVDADDRHQAVEVIRASGFLPTV